MGVIFDELKKTWWALSAAASLAGIVAFLYAILDLSWVQIGVIFGVFAYLFLIWLVYAIDRHLSEGFGRISRHLSEGFDKISRAIESLKEIPKGNPQNPEQKEKKEGIKPSGGGAFVGMIVGGALGLLFGPIGVLVGGIIGSLIGNHIEYEGLKRRRE